MLLSILAAFKEEQTLRDMDGAVQPAPAGKPGTGTLPACGPEDGRRVHYERRRPEDTALYQLVQEHLETFLAQVELETGSGLPDFVKDEFDAFLECGILARGFLRLRCADCGHEKLVAFSCKKRGFCTSCGARRMAETAAHLIDHVIPRVPVRQWVLSFPVPLRCLFAAHPELLAPSCRSSTGSLADFVLYLIEALHPCNFGSDSTSGTRTHGSPHWRGHADPAFWISRSQNRRERF